MKRDPDICCTGRCSQAHECPRYREPKTDPRVSAWFLDALSVLALVLMSGSSRRRVANVARSGMNTPDPSWYRRPPSDQDIEEMNARTEERRKAAIEALGPKWLGYTSRYLPLQQDVIFEEVT